MSANSLVRTTFTVVSRPPHWAVEHDGQDLESCTTREEAMACATRRANASQNAGAPAQIRFANDPTFSRDHTPRA
jgi:hypothetical protein